MEHTHRWNHLVVFGRISQRIREVSPNTANRRRIQGALLLVTSLTFGLWANQAAEKQATHAWLLAHPPSSEVWKHALLSRGYHALQKPAALHRALRSIPTQSDENHTAWMDDQGLWLALFEWQNDQLIPSIYCLQCETPPLSWSRLGLGWSAFELALPALDQALSRQKSRVKPLKTPAASDIRQINY